MEKLVDEGLVRAIGVCNFPVMSLWDLLGGARIPPAINQVECNPRNACSQLSRFCTTNNVAVVAYSPFGSSFAPMLEIDEIKHLSKKYQSSEANIIIRWALQRGFGVLTKSWREERILSNLTQSDFTLEEADLATIAALDVKQRSLDFTDDWGVDVWA
jgi:diketogulonate reductase-like aldo/keto reductase